MSLKSGKATHGQLRRDNRRLLLRAVYTGLANSRAELAYETGLAKPTVSDLISGLITEGYLAETGFGQSTDEGGKRPRLLKFVPEARHLIGVSVTTNRLQGVLANLDGHVLVTHYEYLSGAQGQAVIDILYEVINGLAAQLNAPLLCVGVGVPGLVDARAGLVREASHLGWQNLPLADMLSTAYKVPAYVANSTQLAAMAQYAFGETNNAHDLATILVNDSVGVGMVLDGAIYHTGGEIGYLRLAPFDTANTPTGELGVLEKQLGWQYVKARASRLKKPVTDSVQPDQHFTYLHIRQAIAEGDPEAIALLEELAGYLAQIFAWVLALTRPDHVSLVGSIADLGEVLLDCIRLKTSQLLNPALTERVTFSVDNSPNLVAIGAVAYMLQQELGLI